ncbi:MAG: BatA domain-containing protein [Cytophagaceae bacterium]|nr:BatA domain-containing protein [Cytophagaceae bacterium]MBL0302428.1 BatA domain-containing protein [Cytophagaceae bacterium]
MEFLNPNMLWAGAAVGIPVLIHLWNRKKSTVVQWAAMRWLMEQQQTVARGLNFQEWWLLVLRILAVIFLTTFLARPYFDFQKKTKKSEVLIYQNTPGIKEEFRFEINNREGKFSEVIAFDQKSGLQYFINKNPYLFTEKNATLILEKNRTESSIFLPDTAKILFGNQKENKKNGVLKNGENYYYVENNTLKKSETINGLQNVQLTENKSIKYKIVGEKGKVENSLKSIWKVYGLVFETDEKQPDLIFEISKNELEITDTKTQMIETINADMGNLSFEGALPEKLLDKLLNIWSLKPENNEISVSQMKAGFEVNPAYFPKKNKFYEVYWALAFLVIVATERYFSIKKNK